MRLIKNLWCKVTYCFWIFEESSIKKSIILYYFPIFPKIKITTFWVSPLSPTPTKEHSRQKERDTKILLSVPLCLSCLIGFNPQPLLHPVVCRMSCGLYIIDL